MTVGAAKPKVVLAYSGGLDTSVILKWLSEKGYEVTCFTANVGQQGEDWDAIKAKALACGAADCVISDLRAEFVEEYVFESIKANALYEQRYQLGTSSARPCIAKEQIRIAQSIGAKFVSHGATGKGNDQVRFEMCAQALDPTITTIAPWRDSEFISTFQGRKELLAYCAQHNIKVDAKPKANYSVDENLFHTSYESGMLEDENVSPDESMFKMTTDPRKASQEGDRIEVEFKAGIPIRITDLKNKRTETSALPLFEFANELAGRNGIGRIDIVENRFVGIKSRGVYETPGGELLRIAHLDIEGVCMDREVKRITEQMGLEFSRLCYNGFWFAPEMDLIRNSIDFGQRNVDGVVTLELYKGNTIVAGRVSKKSLYSQALASMDIAGAGADFDYNPADSQGFIRINSVRLKAYTAMQEKIKAMDADVTPPAQKKAKK